MWDSYTVGSIYSLVLCLILFSQILFYFLCSWVYVVLTWLRPHVLIFTLSLSPSGWRPHVHTQYSPWVYHPLGDDLMFTPHTHPESITLWVTTSCSHSILTLSLSPSGWRPHVHTSYSPWIYHPLNGVFVCVHSIEPWLKCWRSDQLGAFFHHRSSS